MDGFHSNHVFKLNRANTFLPLCTFSFFINFQFLLQFDYLKFSIFHEATDVETGHIERVLAHSTVRGTTIMPGIASFVSICQSTTISNAAFASNIEVLII
ncbi:hypothetical protein L6164_018851 [Bauhinia variegata]|uniref:Uncharacterized protein n=1 Tax=Bauhinia variegata TaxID=167791 RepID=A0ACB9NCG3_BAUVA|nr:hypothetical protein L6164_018851 [Bauhinia variegata]